MLTCPLCGKDFKALTAHLRKHDMDAQTFRVRFPGVPLVSESTKKATSTTCNQSGCGLWRKGHKVSPERRKELSEASLGERNPFFGRKHTDETKALMSENHADFNGELNPLRRAIKSNPEIRNQLSNNTRRSWVDPVLYL